MENIIETVRWFYKNGNETDEMDCTIKYWNDLSSAIKYARRYARGKRFAGVLVTMDGKDIFEITSDFEEISNL